jgi:hypothetical protein
MWKSIKQHKMCRFVFFVFCPLVEHSSRNLQPSRTTLKNSTERRDVRHLKREIVDGNEERKKSSLHTLL